MIQQILAEGTPHQATGQQKRRKITTFFAVLLALAKAHTQQAKEVREGKVGINHGLSPATGMQRGKTTHTSILHSTPGTSPGRSKSPRTGKSQGGSTDPEDGIWYRTPVAHKPESVNAPAAPAETRMLTKWMGGIRAKPLPARDTHADHPLSGTQAPAFPSSSGRKHTAGFSEKRDASGFSSRQRLFVPAFRGSAIGKQHALSIAAEKYRAEPGEATHSLSRTHAGDGYSPPGIHGHKGMNTEVQGLPAKQMAESVFHPLATKNHTAANIQASSLRPMPEPQPGRSSAETAAKTKKAKTIDSRPFSRPVTWTRSANIPHTVRSAPVATHTTAGIPSEIQRLQTSSLHGEHVVSTAHDTLHSLPLSATATGTSMIHSAVTTGEPGHAVPSGTWTIPAAMHEIGRAAGQSRLRLELRLEPRHLGKIRVFLDGDELHGIQVHMIVDQSASRQAIEQHLPALKHALMQQGLSLGGFSMSSRHEQESRDPWQREQGTATDQGQTTLSGDPSTDTTTGQHPGGKARLSIHI